MTDKRKMSGDELVSRMVADHEVGTYVDLSARVVERPLKVNGKILRGFDLSNAEFLETVEFSSCIFTGLSWFRDSTFRKTASFSNCQFSNDARFDGASFEANASFDGAVFKGIAGFDNCRVEGDVSFSKIQAHGNVSMSGVQFSGMSDFTHSNMMGGMWCPNGAFDRPLGLSTINLYGRLVTDQSNFVLPTEAEQSCSRLNLSM